ncbi:YdbL family protein [Thalassotalea profundi]|uniref:DUF1318 domain-containing protein n=1 Tax=Thalassotalea profundi TaxID=2036687 RepID=A0ABQ3IG10_9GAMM|nr:YdbL family protein [Thalassotalea profundi]GHE82313.1 hypothetical protein GCM10011501_08100 [Thalassotalea profundi]
MNNIINNFIKHLTTVLFISVISFSAWAISLDDAKQKGLVGEMPDGYIGVVVNNSETRALVESINKKRKNIYIELARENKITMQQVTALAGAKAIQKTQSGHYIMNAAGNWVKK